MITKYRTDRFKTGIQKVQCDSETDSFVFINGCRIKKYSDFEQYHSTFDQARNYLVAELRGDIRQAREKADLVEKTLNKVLTMQPE